MLVYPELLEVRFVVVVIGHLAKVSLLYVNFPVIYM